MSAEVRMRCLELAAQSGTDDLMFRASMLANFVLNNSCMPSVNVEQSAAPPSSDVHKLIAACGRELNVKAEEILGRRRGARIVFARHRAIRAVAEKYPEMSSVEIGKVFNRDHTSILYALKSKPKRFRIVPQEQKKQEASE